MTSCQRSRLIHFPLSQADHLSDDDTSLFCTILGFDIGSNHNLCEAMSREDVKIKLGALDNPVIETIIREESDKWAAWCDAGGMLGPMPPPSKQSQIELLAIMWCFNCSMLKEAISHCSKCILGI